MRTKSLRDNKSLRDKWTNTTDNSKKREVAKECSVEFRLFRHQVHIWPDAVRDASRVAASPAASAGSTAGPLDEGAARRARAIAADIGTGHGLLPRSLMTDAAASSRPLASMSAVRTTRA